jgi:hypothetical protein
MTTQEFISRNFGVTSTKDRSCSSVWADNTGNIYSYGRHYPLLFTVDGVTFVNATGYSNTTAKHINWARQASHDAVNLWVSGCNQYTWRNPDHSQKIPALLSIAHYGMTPAILKALKRAVLADLEAERVNVADRMASKKRTDTQVYRWLIAERDDCIARTAKIKTAWGVK